MTDDRFGCPGCGRTVEGHLFGRITIETDPEKDRVGYRCARCRGKVIQALKDRTF